MSHDNFEQLLDDLLDAEVFELSEGGELQPTGPFRRSRTEHRTEVDRLDDDTFESTLSAYVTGDDIDPSRVGGDTLADAMAVYHAAESVDRRRSLLAAQALERIEATEPASGVPERFVSIDGEDVDAFMRNHPAAIVYFWREDCEPCVGTHEHFETLLAEGKIPERVGLAAVYGPDWADLLNERYQVSVAPTTVFCVDGQIDSRLVGNPGYEAFRIETETIVDATD